MTTPTQSEPTRAKTGIPKNPGRRDLGMRATLLFPDRDIVEKFYVPLVYTACRTCYSEQDPDEIFRRAVDGEFDPLKMQKLIGSVIESGHGSTIEHIVFTFAISGVSPFLGSFLAPKCVPLGYCDEFNNRDEHCPIRPHKDRVLAAWAEKAAEARAAGRELRVDGQGAAAPAD